MVVQVYVFVYVLVKLIRLFRFMWLGFWFGFVVRPMGLYVEAEYISLAGFLSLFASGQDLLLVCIPVLVFMQWGVFVYFLSCYAELSKPKACLFSLFFFSL